MVAMSGSGPGYMQTVIITPYMHSLIYHVPVMLRRHGSLRTFSGQGNFVFLFILVSKEVTSSSCKCASGSQVLSAAL